MIDKFDTMFRRNMMYPQNQTTINQLIDGNKCLITEPVSFPMLNNFTKLYRRNRIFKIVELK